eukprot:88396_1
MKLYIYRGLHGENVPREVTHVIVDESVTSIKKEAFSRCRHLVSLIMGNNIKRIERHAFYFCIALQFIRLSNTLECIEREAFHECRSLEALFIPLTVTMIEPHAFLDCYSLRLLFLPNGIDFSNVGDVIIYDTAIYRIAKAAGLVYRLSCDSHHQVNVWLIHHMDDWPFHRLCYNSSITTKQITSYIGQNGVDSALTIEKIHGMTPLHMLAMNPHAPGDAITALLESNVEAVFSLDSELKTPLDYARSYNVGGLVGMIVGLCNRRNSSISDERGAKNGSAVKRRRIEFD